MLHINKWEPSHLTAIQQLQPDLVLVLDPPVGVTTAIKSVSPRTKVVIRYYVRDQDIHASYLDCPFNQCRQAGRNAAQICILRKGEQPGADGWVVLNEPPTESVEQMERLREFDIGFMEALHDHGMRACIGVFSVGNPKVPTDDGGASLLAYAPALERAAELGAWLALHEYIASRPARGGVAPSGWLHDPRYYALRWQLVILPWLKARGIRIPYYVITESGLDLGPAKKHGYTGEFVGWRIPAPWGYGDSDSGVRDCLNDLLWLFGEYAKDPLCLGVCIFCAGDNGDPKWRSFMVDGVLLGLMAQTEWPKFGAVETPVPAPSPAPAPPSVETVRLRIPYASQLAPVSEADYGIGDCLQSVVAQLARAAGKNVTVNDVARLTGLAKGYTSSHIVTHGVNVAAKLGVRLLWAGRLEPQDIRDEIRAGRSVILRVWYPYLVKKFDANYQNYHFVTVHGFNGDTFFYDDPYWRAQRDGEDIAISAASLRRAAWRTAGGATPAQGLLVRGLQLPKVGAA